ncbi:MAG TPA: shikimate kinase [Candidatus Angelobacter sp.]|nr:shikimate kinase [Candidatus Angelobacter sp.]
MTAATSNRRVFLIGFMGAGKTSAGKAVARRLGWNFCDLDEKIEERQHKKVAAIFAESGEEQFRAMESAALRDLLKEATGEWIIALGGGTFVQSANRAALAEAGAITILLDADLEEIERRCRADGATRPLAQDGNKLRELFENRREVYAKAQFRVETTGKAVDAVAAEICDLLDSVQNREAIP